MKCHVDNRNDLFNNNVCYTAMLEGIAERLRMKKIDSLAQDSMTIHQQENMDYESVIVLHHHIHFKKCPHLKMNTTLLVYPLYPQLIVV